MAAAMEVVARLVVAVGTEVAAIHVKRAVLAAVLAADSVVAVEVTLDPK